MKSGQILILVLLVVVVALAVGLSVASRNLTNLRTSTQSEQSQRAFNAAEGGVEEILSKLNNIIATNPNIATNPYTETVDLGEVDANVKVSALDNEFVNPVELGSVAQVDVDGAIDGNEIQIEWVRKDDSSQSSPKASIEVTVVKLNGGTYSQVRKYYTFQEAGSIGGTESGTFDTKCGATTDYYGCARITLTVGDKIVRIKPFWNKTTARVSGTNWNIPDQQYTIESLANTQTGVTRRVEVTRTKLKQVPAAFDFVLYSESSITK
ncbi:hypothetical protein HY382_02515 [Candidatus Curtissbacteria bacterium]|nr:hypothetical protein [Candidatus Curtissbacteria bacterium]